MNTAQRLWIARRLGQELPTIRARLPREGETHRFRVPDSWQGIRIQIARMLALVRRDVVDPVVLEVARAVVLPCRSKDRTCEVATIFDTVAGNMRFVDDPRGREVIQSPKRMARRLAKGLVAKMRGTIPADAFVMSGDCDEHAVLTAALAGAIGLPVAFGFGGSGGRARIEGRTVPTFHHVWGEAAVDGRWIALDTTGGKALGQTWPFTNRGRVRVL